MRARHADRHNSLSLSLSRRLGTKGRKFPGNVPPANYHCSPWPRPPTPSSSNYSYGSPRLINDTANRARYRVPRIISVAVSRGCCIIPRATCPRKVSITRPPPNFFPQISLSLSSERRTTQQGYRPSFSFSIIIESEFLRRDLGNFLSTW